MRFISSFLIISLSAFFIPSAAAYTPTEDGIYAVFDTTEGEFVAKLYFEQVPLTVANFVGLAENGTIEFQNGVETAIKSAYYDGLKFHRVIDEFMIQGGSPNGLGNDGPGYQFPDELRTLISHSKAGLLSMANSGPNTNGSQFFVTVAPTTWLDDHHTVFGEVVSGMDKVTNISKVPTTNDAPITPVIINYLTIIRKGAAAQDFQSIQVVKEGDDYFAYRALPPAQNDIDLDASTVTLPAEEKYDYFHRSSTDLSVWTDYTLMPFDSNTPETRQHSINPDQEPQSKVFYRYAKNAFIPPFDIAGHKITFSIAGNLYGDFTINMGENGEGTFTQNDGSSTLSGSVSYDLHDLGGYEQLYIRLIYANLSYFEIQLYLPDGSPDSGTAKAVITEDPNFAPNKTVTTDYVISPSS